MLVGVRDAPVMLFLVLVLFGVRSRIAPQTELLDKILTLVVRAQPLKCLAFLVGDDVRYVFVEPLPIRRFQLFAKFVFLPLLLLGSDWLRHGVALRRGRLLVTLISIRRRLRGCCWRRLLRGLRRGAQPGTRQAHRSYAHPSYKVLSFHTIHRQT